VPYLADTKIAVEFKNIVVNSDYQLISGVVETSYNPDWGNVVDVSSILESAEVLIDQIKMGIEELIQKGTITKDEGDNIIKEAEAEHEKIIKSDEEIKEVQEQIAKEKEETKEKQEPTEEQQKKIETSKASMSDAQKNLKDIADKYGAKAGKGSRESDSYFQGLLPLVVNDGTIQVKQIDGKGSFTFKTTDESNLKTYSTIISGKTYTVVITTSNSTKEELEKAKSMVDNPTDGIVIYNHYDLKNNKLGYKVNFASNFFDGVKQQDLEEIKALYAEALNNKLDESQNVIDWGSEIFKATTEINSFFQDLMNKVVLPESIWNPANNDYANSKYKMQALDAGLIDGALEEIKSIPLLISLVVDYTTNKATFDKINKAFSDFSFKEAMKSWYEERKELYKNQPIAKIEHQTGKDVVAVGTLFATGGASAVSKTEKGVNFVEELVAVVKKKGAKEIVEDIWQLSKQKLGKLANSKILGENLEAIGKMRPTNSAAHHIVAGGSKNPFAEYAREFLKKEGIDINEAVNGVFLPKNSKYVIDDAIAHTKVHTNLYYESIYNRLKSTQSNKIRDELLKIQNELLNGTFPY
jgi:hypothetical protein